MGYLDAGVFIALACQGRWRFYCAGVRGTLALRMEPERASLTLA
jgi:hypothetical protein